MAKCTVLEVLCFSFFCAETLWSSLPRYSQLFFSFKSHKVLRWMQSVHSTCDAECCSPVQTLEWPNLITLLMHLGLGESLCRYSRKLGTTVQKLWAWKTTHLCSTRCTSRLTESFTYLKAGAGVWTLGSVGTLPSFWQCLQLQRIVVVIGR